MVYYECLRCNCIEDGADMKRVMTGPATFVTYCDLCFEHKRKKSLEKKGKKPTIDDLFPPEIPDPEKDAALKAHIEAIRGMEKPSSKRNE